MSDKKKTPQEDNSPENEAIEAEVIEVSAETVSDEVQAEETNAETDTAQPEVAEKTDDAPAKPAKKEKKPATWPGKLALPLSIIALGASGYLYWLSMQQNTVQAANNASIDTQVSTSLKESRASLDSAIANMNQQLGQLQSQSSADKNNIDELQQRLTKSIQQVSANQQTSRKDWLLAEVEYLLRLANQRVLMEQTATGALSLLKSADKILKETDDVSIYEVRKALAADITALETVPTLDTEGVFLKLGALSKQVVNLRMTPLSTQHKLPDLLEEVTPESVSESWSAGLEESWSKAVGKLNQLVVVQHRDEPIEPLLSPQQTYYLQQNLHLMLEQAQLALLQKKQASYDASLGKAHEWLNTYFEKNDPTTQGLLRGISDLQSIRVTTEMPDISGSLRSVKGYLQQMSKLREEGAS